MRNKNLIALIKYFLVGLVLLGLFHFETLSIGPLKISHLWKGMLLVFLIFSVIRSKKRTLFIYKPLFMIALLQILNVELINNTQNAIISFGTSLIIPFFGVFLIKYPTHKLKTGLLFCTSFFILAFVPYELGILESIEDGYNLEVYGSDLSGLIGPFQTVHSASMALGGSFLVVLYFLLDKTFNRTYLSILLILCFYFLFSTYVRTGMAMAAFGSLPLMFYFGKKEFSTRVRLVFAGTIITFMISAWVLSNPILLNRITGETIRGSETESAEKLGSGRGSLWQYAIEVYADMNILEKIIGIGQSDTLDKMSKKTHHKIFPHNGFLQILLVNGLIGLVCLLYYFRKVYRLRKRLTKEHFILIKALFFAFFVMSLFQNHELLYFHILMMITITMFVQKSYYLKTRFKDYEILKSKITE